MATKELTWDEIPQDIRQEAEDLARGAVRIDPDGALGLARKILLARNEGRPMLVKAGFDPNMIDLHIGHGTILKCLRRFQDRGHIAVVIIGGCTATIGDPTGRLSGRPELTDDSASQNVAEFKAQLPLILDMSKNIKVLNNADWLNDLGFVWVMKNLKRLFTMNEILSRFKDHLGNDATDGLRSDAPDYPFLQGWDSVHVRADVEIGGIDQLSNLLMGRRLQPEFGQEPQVVLMLPLLLGLDGTRKMSKSFGNSIGLRDEPDDMFGKCMRIQDGQIVNFLELATTLSVEEIEAEKKFLASGGNPRDAKERLATRIVLELHGEEAAQAAVATWRRIHSERAIPDEVAASHVVAEPTGVVKLLVETGLAKSNTMARNHILQGGVRIDNVPVTDDRMVITVTPEKSVVLSFGRRKFVRLIAAS